MTNAKVVFSKIIQDSQEYGSNDEYMASRVFFDLFYNEKEFKNLYVDIKQTVGGDYEKTPIEVGKPIGYKGAFNYGIFRNETEKYYREAVGKSGNAIKTLGKNVRMYNNIIEKSKKIEININDSGAGW